MSVRVRPADDGWAADVTVAGTPPTQHVVLISRAEQERYGGGDVEDLVRRTFAFLLALEPATAILPEFRLSTVQGYFPDFEQEIRR